MWGLDKSLGEWGELVWNGTTWRDWKNIFLSSSFTLLHQIRLSEIGEFQNVRKKIIWCA